MKAKKLYEMSDDEVLKEVAVAIRDYLEQIRPQNGEFVLHTCVSRQVECLKQLYSRSRGLGKNDTLKTRDVEALTLHTMHFLPLIQERTLAVKLRYDKEQAVWKIRGTSAEAQIIAAFQEVGMKAAVERQRYRAKVVVDLGGRKLRFYVGYKTLEKEETLPAVVQAVLDLEEAVGRIGGDVKISR